ncbi:DOPA 4,5-dioxygenase family protein [Oceanimonas doudoroffii]|uniref:4,5-dioxygenase n=1 Tax=Oceanimonas doudoroffii TaxID=84158 RepID=A0A233RFK1_9GAMM|nr:DOPA 4,5-dioxygenase family protein [Oceanimonas doudoroffii]OXY82163.1 4,5-dioxygenase [Oceanimonas doudoroffii]
MSRAPVNQYDAYHAHVYFDAHTLAFATELCQRIANEFSLEVGRIHQKPVGPHTRWSCQVKFTHADFDRFIPWLERHRGTLSVLVHADTGDDLADHTTHAYWLGEAVALNVQMFK